MYISPIRNDTLIKFAFIRRYFIFQQGKNMREWSRRVKYNSASNEQTSKEVAAAIALARLFNAVEI